MNRITRGRRLNEAEVRNNEAIRSQIEAEYPAQSGHKMHPDDLPSLPRLLEDEFRDGPDAARAFGATLASAEMIVARPDAPRSVSILVGMPQDRRTDLVRTAAKHMFGSESAVIQIDVAAYAGEGCLAQMTQRIGGGVTAAHGHFGGGVLLLNEWEKGHPSLHNVLLGIVGGAAVRLPSDGTCSLAALHVVLTTSIGMADVLTMPTANYWTLNKVVVAAHRAAFPAEIFARFSTITVFLGRSQSPTQDDLL